MQHFSYDTRGAHAGTPSHWRDEEVLEDRAVFHTHREPAELILNPVQVINKKFHTVHIAIKWEF